MRHAPLDVFAPSCLDMHGEYILTLCTYHYGGNGGNKIKTARNYFMFDV
jgi:hypothetical protein